MNQTSNKTEDQTNEADQTEDETPDSTDNELIYEPPCRAAARYMVACPNCGRQVQIRTLMYTHICGRSFNATERAMEQKKAAEIAAIKRNIPNYSVSKAATTRTEHQQKHPVVQPMENKHKDYSKLLNF